MIPNMYGVKQMNVVRFVIQETGTYNQQYRRPYQTSLDVNAKNLILETVDQAKAITPTALANVAQQFIKPMATPEALVDIAHGWQEPRFRFMLEVQTQDRTGMMTTKEYVVGYTDHPGLSYGGALDPNMVFFVNGVNTVRESRQVTPVGTQMHQSMVDASHVLVNNQYTGLNAQNQLYGLRPEDVYDQIDNRTIMAAIDNGMVMDGRTKITGQATKSKRSNAVAPVYMANVLDSYLQTARNQKDDSNHVIMETARSTVESSSITEDPFMAFVRTCSAMTGGNSFTLANLMQLDPNVMNVMRLDPLTPEMRGTLHRSGMTSDWGASDYTTLFATTLAQSVPSYMLAFGINKIRILSTNESIDGKVETKIVAARTLQQHVDISRELQAFTFRLENEVLRNLSYNNQMSFQLDLTVDLLGDTWVNVSLNGQPAVPYVMPSFCDALMAPVTTTNYNNLDGAANDFEALMTEVYEADAAHGAGGIMRTGII